VYDQRGDRGDLALARAPRRANLALMMVPALLVLVTFLFWYQTWYGRPLSDQDLEKYLTDTTRPRQVQHALSQIADRMAQGDASVRRWYSRVVALAAHKEPKLRAMTAWVMSQDNQSAEFHASLRSLLTDSEPMVRRNAALALVRFGDAAGRPELRAMLEPYSLAAPAAGTVSFRLKEDDSVRVGIAVARVRPARGDRVEVVSPLDGRLERRAARDGAPVSAGDLIAVIAPAEDQVWEALRALYLVGTPEDLEVVERFLGQPTDTSERVRQQAARTATAIRQRMAARP